MFKQPGQEIGLLVAVVTAQLRGAVLSTRNEFTGHSVIVTGPGGELHITAEFFYRGKNLLVFRDRANPVLIAMKSPDGNFRDLGRIDKLLCPFQPTTG